MKILSSILATTRNRTGTSAAGARDLNHHTTRQCIFKIIAFAVLLFYCVFVKCVTLCNCLYSFVSFFRFREMANTFKLLLLLLFCQPWCSGAVV